MSPRKRPGNRTDGFTADERAAMKERAHSESAVRAKIAEMPEPDRSMATRLHAIVKAAAPSLSPKTWYGMPAYARDGQVVCFFQGAQKFKARYATFAAVEARSSALVKRAAS